MVKPRTKTQRGFTISFKASDIVNKVAIETDLSCSRVVDLMILEYGLKHGIEPDKPTSSATLSQKQIAAIKARNVLRQQKLTKEPGTARQSRR